MVAATFSFYLPSVSSVDTVPNFPGVSNVNLPRRGFFPVRQTLFMERATIRDKLLHAPRSRAENRPSIINPDATIARILDI